MSHASPPYERLRQFIALLGLGEAQANPLSPWSDALLPHAREFARLTREFVLARPQLRIIMENLPHPPKLLDNWTNWYTMIVSTGVDDALLDRLWGSGQAHVAHNVDHRHVSLAYALARSFLHERIMEGLPQAEQAHAMTVADKMIDLSLMVETDAFVTSAAKCELEVIEGVSHQVRNPVSIIGGFARKLLKRHPEDGEDRQAASTILAETLRLERMARSVNAYLDVAQADAPHNPVPLESLLALARDKALGAASRPGARVSVAMDLADPVLTGDGAELAAMFESLIGNALMLADADDPRVDIAVQPNQGLDNHALITIASNGPALDDEGLIQAFSPFHSSEPADTGFNLPMARMIADRHSGNITLAALEPHGLKCVVTLPLHDAPSEGQDRG